VVVQSRAFPVPLHPGRWWVGDLLREILSFVEGDAKWWDDAAGQCESIAKNLSLEDQAKWHLLCAVYRERAQAHRELVNSIGMRQASGN
jgi:hypothetical protein